MYNETITIPLLPGECWWGGAVQDGTHMPFGALPHRRAVGGPGVQSGESAASFKQREVCLVG